MLTSKLWSCPVLLNTAGEKVITSEEPREILVHHHGFLGHDLLGRKPHPVSSGRRNERLDHPSRQIIRKCIGGNRKLSVLIGRKIRLPESGILEYSAFFGTRTSFRPFTRSSLLPERSILHFEFLDQVHERDIGLDTEIPFH